MDYIKTWTFCICITLIISVILSILAPKGTMGKFYKVIISTFIFLSFLYPLSDFNIADFKLDFDFGSEYTNVVEDAAKVQIENAVETVLDENKVYNSIVSAIVSQNGDELTINSVKISVADSYSVEEVKDIVFKELGVVAEVKHIGE
ncbi:MAG: hypothetical protein J1E05_00355 [Eubacterium sp.]|nr:hypothetical protein [Eubacterium sp.]